jgi:hypothetical protein
MSPRLEPLTDELFGPLVADEQRALLGGRTAESPPFCTYGVKLTDVAGPTIIVDGVTLLGRQIADEVRDAV